jgi:FkbM family methyltransferase
MIKIFYGISQDNSIDVTDICLDRLTINNIINIPCTESTRATIFTDPYYGILKYIYILNDGIFSTYDYDTHIKINLTNNTIESMNSIDIDNKIKEIHSKLKINYGNFYEELSEQKMVFRYLTGNEKVLEIGGNIGRNSLIIASILQNSNNLVTLESDINIAKQLTENRDLNNFNFHIENAALSNRKLLQKGWDTIPSDILLEGYTWINTITLANLQNKYNIDFDTLVLDCEGAFYYILLDMPEILNNINLIIMENDYWDIIKKNYIDSVLTENNFFKCYIEGGGWGPCANNFFEVWCKTNH